MSVSEFNCSNRTSCSVVRAGTPAFVASNPIGFARVTHSSIMLRPSAFRRLLEKRANEPTWRRHLVETSQEARARQEHAAPTASQGVKVGPTRDQFPDSKWPLGSSAAIGAIDRELPPGAPRDAKASLAATWPPHPLDSIPKAARATDPPPASDLLSIPFARLRTSPGAGPPHFALAFPAALVCRRAPHSPKPPR